MKYRTILLAIGLFAIITSSCGTENPFSRGLRIDDDFSDLTPGVPVSFSGNVVPLLSNCISCHGSGTGGWTYSGGAGAYTSVITIIDKGNPTNSSLLVNAIGESNHGGGTLYTRSSPDYATILLWIEQGALDN